MSRPEPLLLLVGGFLGSGKTTLLLAAAARLRARGLRVALITNDQGGALVDTRLAVIAGVATEEVIGGCFCCRFSEFTAAAERLLQYDPDVILAEPVGSCIDISATILQPLKHYYRGRFRLAPFTVLVDPQKAKELADAQADPYTAYLFTNQLAEADLVCCNKSDLHSSCPAPYDMRLSALTGEGVAEWLDEVLAGSRVPGSRLLEVDYGYYAEAEAALGWLNWHAHLRLDGALSPPAVVGPLLDDLEDALSRAEIDIAHLKVFDDAPTGYLKASLCRNGEDPLVQGNLDASPAQTHELIVNLRARAAPERLEAIVKQATGRLPGEISVHHLESFRPAAPNPEHRLTLEGSQARVRFPGQTTESGRLPR
jgi:Ni2+-binding GTPase involved in maturation of urease and hydrogenase